VKEAKEGVLTYRGICRYLNLDCNELISSIILKFACKPKCCFGLNVNLWWNILSTSLLEFWKASIHKYLLVYKSMCITTKKSL